MPLRSRATRLRPVLAGLALTCAITACAPAPPPVPAPTAAPQAPSTAAAPLVPTRIVTMRRSDGVRSAIVHHPGSADAGAPLVVVLHPAAVSASTTEVNFGWDALADRDGFVVAYPEGVLDGFGDTWNAGRCCPPADELPADDVGFLDALVTALRRTDAVGHRVYAVGFSNGAMLAYAWACGRPTLTGMGVVAGSLTTDCPAPAPLTVVALHGAADDQVPLAGGPGPSGTTFPSLDASLAPFRAGCAEAAPVATGPARVEVRTCPDGRRVVTAVVDGIAHTWPGAGPAAGTSDGPLDATGFLWAHLRG